MAQNRLRRSVPPHPQIHCRLHERHPYRLPHYPKHFHKILRQNNNSFSLNSCGRDSDLKKFLPQTIRPYLIISSVLISFILLFIDWRKAQIIIKSRDISYSFTSPIAYRYYVLRSYAHYCLFCQIQNSRRTIDILAFFVFFQFKGWCVFFL
ncbi:hypothetical protein BC829DRAFT_223273 [Chytridium lagenaria]|nr:hypothetical protein BC829DRAFT_223273 [Chytridium lagenaria]